MSARYLIILFLCWALSASADEDPLARLKNNQPRDVVKLIDRMVGCNHWSGEEPYDADRRKEISSALAALKCARLAKDEAAAHKRYAQKPSTIKVLQQARETSY